MQYKVYDVGESIQIDILSSGRDEKIDQYVLPKNTLDMFMLLKNTIDDEVMRLHSVIRKDNEYVNTPYADLLNTISHAITEHKEEKIIENVSKSVASDIDVYKRV